MVVLQHLRGDRALRLLIALFAGACGAPAEDSREEATLEARAAITNGAATSDANVAALVSGSTLVCTATLVSPRVLLTAAHCVPDAPPDAVFGADPARGTRVRVLAVKRHPTFDAKTLADDVAMLLLESAPGATPATLASTIDAGLAIRLVGFGKTSASDTSPPLERVGTSTIASLGAKDFSFGPSPSQTCGGDSGGPAFATIGGVEVLVGVTSSGDTACASMARDVRVDAYRAFIDPWLAQTAAGAAKAGDRCFYGANCASGECAPALDDPALSFCAPPCDAGCPAPLACIADGSGRKLCRHPAPSPGALGATCADATECASGRCLAPASGGSGVCTSTCFRDVPGFCASGYECAAASGTSDLACFAPKPSEARGCSVRGGRGANDGPEGFAIAIALLFLSRRRATPTSR